MLTLAGCTQDQDDASIDDDVDPGAFDELGLEGDGDLGIIKGVVFDGAVRPLADADVLLLGNGENRTATTTEQGVFGFDRLPPGVYQMTVSKSGYSTVSQDVDVEAGVLDPSVTKFLLTIDAAQRPFYVFKDFRGYIECQASVVTYEPPPCSWFFPDDVANSNLGDQFELNEGLPDAWQAEMHWEKSTELSDAMTFSYICTTCAEGAAWKVYGRDRGPSPLLVRNDVAEMGNDTIGEPDTTKRAMMRVEAGAIDPIEDQQVHDAYGTVTGEDCLEYPNLPRVESGCMEFYGAGMAFQQDFEVFNHLFYKFLPEDDWVFTEDGHPVVPEAPEDEA